MIEVDTLVVGQMQTNCYLVSSQVSPRTVTGTPGSSEVKMTGW